MKRENKKFLGELSDKELYLIEDALNCYIGKEDTTGKKIESGQNIITKLYIAFWEAPDTHKRPNALIANYRQILASDIGRFLRSENAQ